MSTDRLGTDFCCSDCNKSFESASFLLTHFALHASQSNNFDQNEAISLTSKKKNIPDLYPINISIIKNKFNEKNENKSNIISKFKSETVVSNFSETKNSGDYNNCNEGNNLNVQIEIDSEFNPLKYCSISMEIKEQGSPTSSPEEKKPPEKNSAHSTKKKYPCSYCSKVFGWSTDLKRHVLRHTGERPFRCKYCVASFTRNFLLQKHESKAHPTQTSWEPDTKTKVKMPSLKPIITKVNQIKVKDSRKQDKQKIKRKCYYSLENGANQEFYGMMRSPLNFIDKETVVQ